MRGEASTETPTRTAILCDFGNFLKLTAAERGVAVLVTNHLTRLPFHGLIRTLGGAWGQIATHCFETRTSSLGDRILRVRKSPCLARVDLSFTVSGPEAAALALAGGSRGEDQDLFV
jgi:hypothetical protein